MTYISELRTMVGTRPLILPGAAVIVLDSNDHVLLLQRADTGGWGLPGGFMDPGESLEQTARREVMEEVGLELDELTLMSVFSGPEQYYRYPNGDQVFNVTTVYTAKARHWSLRLDPQEATTARLFPADELPADLITPEVPIMEHYSKSRNVLCDGFAVGSPLFGVMVGVLKHDKPVAGGVVLPDLSAITAVVSSHVRELH